METTREYTEQLRQSLIRLSAGLSDISESLPEQEHEKCDSIVSQLNRSVIPQLEADWPLLIAVTGGGSTGKSTLFNALAGKKISASGPTAGLTKRMVAAINPKVVADERKMDLLFERFRANAYPRKLENPDEAVLPGEPVYVECPDVPEHLVLIDTPDFDTGTPTKFANRASAKEILDVADAILYIATNTSYNNKANTDFVRGILSEVGLRKVALLYRFSPVYGDDIVRGHMGVLLSNLYPDERTAKESCIGIWRIDESNDVAAGVRELEIRPLAGGIPLAEALAALDPTKTRVNVMKTTIEDALHCADGWVGESKAEALKYEAYRDALRFLTSDTCRKCLETTPQRDILRVFNEAWKAAQPFFVRNGNYIPRFARGVGTWVKSTFVRKKPVKEDGPEFQEIFRKTFLDNARNLQKAVEAPSVGIDFPKTSKDLRALSENIRQLSEKDPGAYSIKDLDRDKWTATIARPSVTVFQKSNDFAAGKRLSSMMELATNVMGDTESIRPGVKDFVKTIRKEMTRWQKAKEWFSASLDTVAIAGALTYVAFTGDAFTGGTLVSMFGLNDLVAVPALGAFIAAHSSIDAKTAEKMMRALFTTWASQKVKDIRKILEDGITGADIAVCDEQGKRLGENLQRVEKSLAAAREQANLVFG